MKDIVKRTILRRAIARIEDPDKWTKCAFARDVDGNNVTPRNPKAVCWCAEGAIETESIPSMPSWQVLCWMDTYIGSALYVINDKCGYQPVIDTMREILRKAGG